MYGTGISKIGTLLDTALDFGIVERAGAWYSYDGERLGQGRENAKTFIAENLDLHKKLEKELRDTLHEQAQREQESDGLASDRQSNAANSALPQENETFTLD